MRGAETGPGTGLTDRQWLARGAIGIALYALLAVAPVALMVLSSPPTPRTLIREFSVSLAFGALAVLGLQIVLTSRVRRLKAPYGIDAVYHFHRVISFVALSLVLAHVALLVADDLETLQLFNVFTAPNRARLGILALLALCAVVLLSVLRRRIGLGYEIWRYSHGALALLMIASAVGHVELVGRYVNTPLKRELWLAYPALWAIALVWARILKPALLLRRPWVVDSVRPERGRSWTLSLKRDGARMRFDPGQFVWLHLGSSPFAMAEHPFSISSSAARSSCIELTVKELGDFTSRIGQTGIGQAAYLDGPYGQFSVDRHRAEAYVFVAGGVGITPIMSMLRTLRDRDDRRPLTLIYGVESLDEMTFLEEIREMSGELSLEFVPVLSRPPSDWKGEQGRIDVQVLAKHRPESLAQTEFFICGPEVMMNVVSRALREIGAHPGQIRYELFGLV